METTPVDVGALSMPNSFRIFLSDSSEHVWDWEGVALCLEDIDPDLETFDWLQDRSRDPSHPFLGLWRIWDDNYLSMDDPNGPGLRKDADLATLNRQGLAFAAAVKRFVGSDRHIFFHPEDYWGRTLQFGGWVEIIAA